MPRVLYARVNRRTAEPMLAEHTFREDMAILAEAGALEVEGRDGTEWVAADLELDSSGDFLTGILGFVAEEALREFASEVKSWKKGDTRIVVGASRRTLTPFAVDVRDDQRWLAFVPTTRIQPPKFVIALQHLLSKAVTDLGLLPAEWDVNLIPSRGRVFEWLEEHRDVSRLRRTIKAPNPGKDFSEEIERMRRLGAGKKREEYVPRYNRTLNLRDDEILSELLEGVERGDVQIVVQTRSGLVFNTAKAIEEGTIEDWEDDWDLATALILDALREYVEGRATPLEFPTESS